MSEGSGGSIIALGKKWESVLKLRMQGPDVYSLHGNASGNKTDRWVVRGVLGDWVCGKTKWSKCEL